MATVTTEPGKANAVETIEIKIDGRTVHAPRTMPDPLTGKPIPTTMIQACAIAATDVPHYCYHPKLPVAGNCRMCLVEFGTPAMGPNRQPMVNPDGTPKINKSPRPAIACATPISPGMEIYTATPAVTEMRKGVLEFLLINHPLDCPICDQAGECKLQEYSVEYGQSESRFVEEKVHKPKQIDLGSKIMLDDERCILCSRCIRFTRDVVGDDALGFVNRGSYNTLAAYPGKSFENNYTLNTVDICPVGALTSKDFRFKMRVWFLKETKTLCTSCSTGCNTVVGTRESNVFRYEPRENDAVNSSWMCDYGRLNYKWINRPDRLTSVVRRPRAGEEYPMVSWEAALSALVPLFRQAPKGSVAMLISARQTNEELYLLKKLADATGAVTDIFPRTGESDHLLLSADRNPNTTGARLMGVTGAEPGARLREIADGIRARKFSTVLVFGEDLLRIGLTEAEVRQIENLVVSDILPNGTTALAHYVLPGCAHVEKRGSFVNGKGRVQKFMKAIDAKGDSRPEIEFLATIVGEVTGLKPSISVEGVFNQLCREVPAFSGLDWARLGDSGTTIQI